VPSVLRFESNDFHAVPNSLDLTDGRPRPFFAAGTISDPSRHPRA
jgi:hypothetical protein